MSKYFAVRHQKLGFVISYFIPIAFVLMLWDSKRIRKGILLILGMELGFALLNFLDYPYGLGLYIVATGFFLWAWWKYYNGCVDVLKSKSDLITR